MSKAKTHYRFNWEQILKFSNPAEKQLEGTEKRLLFQDWGYSDLDFEFHVIYRYINAQCLGRPPAGARRVAMSTMAREIDIRSFDGFEALKESIDEIIDNCPSEKIEEIMYRACAILAQRGHFAHVPEKWQPIVAEHCQRIGNLNS